jgi:hypothetical protein
MNEIRSVNLLNVLEQFSRNLFFTKIVRRQRTQPSMTHLQKLL